MKNYSYQRLKKICLDNTADVETIKAAATKLDVNLWIEPND